MSTPTTFSNPILRGFNPDPSICSVPGKGYFIVTSTFEYFPGLPIYHSQDLQSWKLIGHAINHRSQGVDMRTVETSAGLWAPTIRYHNGRIYVACAIYSRMRFDLADFSNSEVLFDGFYVSTDDIFDDAKWSQAVYFEEVGFDQDLFFDDDGKVYQTLSRFDFSGPVIDGIPKIDSYVNEIDLVTGSSLTSPVLVEAKGSGVIEGCHIIKRDGLYYLFGAEGGTQEEHQERVYRSDRPTGPFEAPPAGVNPIVYNGQHPHIRNTGHMDAIETSSGQWVACFLGVRPVFAVGMVPEGLPSMTSHLGRESFMSSMDWVEGWPVINGGKPIELNAFDQPLNCDSPKQSWRDDFASQTLQKGWYQLRVPLRQTYSLTEKPGHLALRGSPRRIDVEHSPTMFLRKQTSFDLDWLTILEFSPRVPGEEAGTVVWVSQHAYASLGIGRDEGGNMEIVFTSVTGKTRQRETFKTNLPLGSAVVLSIKARRQSYEFTYTEGAGVKVAGSVASSSLKPLFTGAHLGMYAQGVNSMPCLNWAFFQRAEWVEVEP